MDKSPSLELTTAIGGSNTVPMNIYVSSTNPSEASSFWTNLSSNVNLTLTTLTYSTATLFDIELLNRFDTLKKNWFDIYATSLKTNVGNNGLYQYEYYLWMNSTMPHSGH